MIRGTLEPSRMPIVVRTVPIVVQAIRQNVIVPQMTSPHERQPREQR
jgi:hypothetical protein